VSRLGRDGCAPRDAGRELTPDEITRAAQKALEKCGRENSKWTRADVIANLGRVVPRRAADPDGQARLLEEVAGRALAGEFGPVVCIEAPEAVPVPACLRRADGRSVYQRHGGVKYATRVQLSREEKLVAQAGARGGPAAAAVWSGSHLDTVPNGGANDGAVGVVAALECVRRIAEEGVGLRFQPGDPAVFETGSIHEKVDGLRDHDGDAAPGRG
jgi:hypothetical protein